MGFLIIALICIVATVIFERKGTRYCKILAVSFTFLCIVMLVIFAFCPRTEYKEAELIYEIHLDEEILEDIENIGFEMSEVDLDKLIRLNDDVDTIDHINLTNLTNLKFVDSDLTEGITIQIYKSAPEISFWKPSPGYAIYDCIILW